MTEVWTAAHFRVHGFTDGASEIQCRLRLMPEPLEDTFVRARDIAFAHGLLLAIDYDTEDWLSVAEEAGSDWHGVWHFPIPEDDPAERIAWAAMRSSWMQRAEKAGLSQITHPSKVVAFIEDCPGLAEACAEHPSTLAEMAPTVTVPGFGGIFEEALQSAFVQETTAKQSERRWALRSPDFGGRTPYDVMHGFVRCGGKDAYFDTKSITVVVWLLSAESAWLPQRIREFLIEGARQYAGWTRDSGEWRIYDLVPEWDDFTKNGPLPELTAHLRAMISEACSSAPWQPDSEEVFGEFERRDFLGAWLDPQSPVSPNKHWRHKGKSDDEVVRSIARTALDLGDPSVFREALEAIVLLVDSGQGALSDQVRSTFSLAPQEE